MRNWMWPGLFVLGLAATVGYSLVPATWAGRESLFACILALAIGASVSGRHHARAGERTAWLCTSIALGALLVGGLIGALEPAAAIGPFRAVDDLIFLPSLLALAVAAATLGAARKGDRDRMALLDAAILTAAAAVVAWNCVAERYIGDADLATTTRLVACAHPLADVLVIGLSLRLLLTRDGRDRSTVSFATGAMLLVAVHLLSGGLGVPGSVQAGSTAGPLWLVSFLLIGFAALLPSDVPATHSGMAMAMGRTRLLVVLAAVFVPEVVLALDLSHRGLIGLDTPTVVVCVSTLLIALAAVRIMRSLEARLSALIFHSTDAIFLVDRDGRIAFASPSAEELRGRSANDLVGTSLLDSFVEDAP